jgi:outer membrane protein assembly factor BamB
MISQGEREAAIAADAATGTTKCEFWYEAPTKGMDYGEGKGPHATPLITGDLVFTAGATGKLHALDKHTGKMVWSHDLWKEMGGTKLDQGYSCSPIAYRDTVIVTVGGPGQAVVAFRQSNGKIAWKKHDFKPSQSSPVLIDVDGQQQLVVFLADEIVGLDPDNGGLLWRFPHQTKWGLNVSTPVWGEGDMLFCSSGYNGGSRALKLIRKDGKTTVDQIWFNRRIRVHTTNVVRVGDYIYCSSGDFGAILFSAIVASTGKVVWQVRLPKANILWADGKVLLLDETGQLTLASVSPEGLTFHSRAAILTEKAWTVPRLVGKTLFLRDRKVMVAVDIG